MKYEEIKVKQKKNKKNKKATGVMSMWRNDVFVPFEKFSILHWFMFFIF